MTASATPENYTTLTDVTLFSLAGLERQTGTLARLASKHEKSHQGWAAMEALC